MASRSIIEKNDVAFVDNIMGRKLADTKRTSLGIIKIVRWRFLLTIDQGIESQSEALVFRIIWNTPNIGGIETPCAARLVLKIFLVCIVSFQQFRT